MARMGRAAELYVSGASTEITITESELNSLWCKKHSPGTGHGK